MSEEGQIESESQGGLFEDVITGRLEPALQKTAAALKAGAFAEVEDAWIACLARAGDATIDAVAAKRWWDTCVDVLDCCESEALRPKDALMATAKILLLIHGLGSVRPPRPSTMAQLRSVVLARFPEKVRLTPRGTSLFERLLTEEIQGPGPGQQETEPSPERAFAERILVGLMQLWEEGAGGGGGVNPTIRACMEYLVRKKQLVLHMPGNAALWPYPSLEESDKGDMIWFLWGAWLCVFGEWATPLWKLYTHTYRKTLRMDRIGLLYGCRSLLAVPRAAFGKPTTAMASSDQAILDWVDTHALDIWKHVTCKTPLTTVAMSESTAPMGASLMCGADKRAEVWDMVPRAKGIGMRAASSQQQDSVRPPDIKKLSIRKNQEDDFYEDAHVPEEPEHDDGYGYANDTVEDYSETYPTEYYRQDFNRQDLYDSPGSPRGSREHQSHPSQVRQRSIDAQPQQQREPIKPNIPKQSRPQSVQSRQQSRQSQAPFDRAGIWGLNPRQNRNGA